MQMQHCFSSTITYSRNIKPLTNRTTLPKLSLHYNSFWSTPSLRQFRRCKPSPEFISSFSEPSFFSTKPAPIFNDEDGPKRIKDLSSEKQLKRNQFTGTKPLHHSYKITLEKALKERKVSVAWGVFEELLKTHSVKYVSTLQLSRLLSLLVKHSESSTEIQNNCQTLISTMDSLNLHFKSSRELYSLLLYQHKYGTTEQVQRTFYEISSMECIPNVYASNIYLDALGKISAKLSFKEFESLLSKGMKPDVFTLSALLKSCRNENDLTLISKVYDASIKLGIKLNNVCYSILIDTYGKSLRPEKAREIFNSMRQEGITVDTVTFNTVLNSMTKSGQFKDILMVYSDITRSGLTPNRITFNTLLKGIVFNDEFKKKSLDFVRNEMQKYQIPPNIVTYNTLLKGYFLHEDCEKAEQLYQEILKYSQPDIITFNTMIEGYSVTSISRAVQWMEEMQKYNVIPNCSTYNTIMNGHLKMNKPEKALELYEVLKRKKISTTSITYGILINCYSYLRNHSKVVSLWTIAVKKFPLYTLNGVLSVVLDSYGYHSSSSELRGFWLKLKELSFPFSENNLSAYIEGLCHLGDVAHAVQAFWIEYDQYKLQPSEKTVEIISRFLIKSSNTTLLNIFSKKMQSSFPDLYNHLLKRKLVF